MGVVCPIKAIIKCRTGKKNDVPAFKQPVDVLKSVLFHIRMPEKNFMNGPVSEIGGTLQYQGITYGTCRKVFKFIGDQVGNGPVPFCFFIITDGKFPGATGKINESGQWIKRGGRTVCGGLPAFGSSVSPDRRSGAA